MDAELTEKQGDRLVWISEEGSLGVEYEECVQEVKENFERLKKSFPKYVTEKEIMDAAIDEFVDELLANQ